MNVLSELSEKEAENTRLHEIINNSESVSSKSEAKQACRELSEELYEFLAERARDDYGLENLFRYSSHANEELAQQRWEDHTSEMQRHSSETMARFKQRFAARVAGLVATLRSQGLITSEDAHRLEHTVNPLGIEEIARILASVGHKL